MNKRLLRDLTMMSLMGAVLADKYHQEDDYSKTLNIKKEKQTVIPKGTKEYFFNNEGEFSTTSMLKSETIFTCIASNDKNAIRKFNKRKIK